MYRICAKAMGMVCVATLVAAMGFAPLAKAQDRITIGTNPAGTFYNQLGGQIATIVQDKTGVQATTRPFSGTSVYLPMLQRGEITFGINSALDSWNAYMGLGVYQQPMTNVRGALLVYQAPYGYFVKDSSGLRTIADLKGKKVIVTQRAIASFDKFNEALLASAGLTPADVTLVTVSGVAESLRALTEGRADAAPVIIGFPLLREADAAISGGLRVLALGPDDSKIDALPGISTMTLKPAKPLIGIKEPTKVARFDVYLNTGTDIPADTVYMVVKTTYGNWEVFQKELPPLRGLKKTDLVPVKMSLPFHDGAVRFFKEAGLWSDMHQARQEELLTKKSR
jgi:TRAP transporter TAXI family solute receptor